MLCHSRRFNGWNEQDGATVDIESRHIEARHCQDARGSTGFEKNGWGYAPIQSPPMPWSIDSRWRSYKTAGQTPADYGSRSSLRWRRPWRRPSRFPLARRHGGKPSRRWAGKVDSTPLWMLWNINRCNASYIMIALTRKKWEISQWDHTLTDQLSRKIQMRTRRWFDNGIRDYPGNNQQPVKKCALFFASSKIVLIKRVVQNFSSFISSKIVPNDFWWQNIKVIFFIPFCISIILIPIPSPQARFTPSPASPPPSYGPINFLIIQDGAEDYQNLETSTIQGENWLWNGSRLIDWLGITKMSRDR